MSKKSNNKLSASNLLRGQHRREIDPSTVHQIYLLEVIDNDGEVLPGWSYVGRSCQLEGRLRYHRRSPYSKFAALVQNGYTLRCTVLESVTGKFFAMMAESTHIEACNTAYPHGQNIQGSRVYHHRTATTKVRRQRACKKAHATTAAITDGRVSPEAIYEMWRKGMSAKNLADAWGVSRSFVYNVIRNKEAARQAVMFIEGLNIQV